MDLTLDGRTLASFDCVGNARKVKTYLDSLPDGKLCSLGELLSVLGISEGNRHSILTRLPSYFCKFRTQQVGGNERSIRELRKRIEAKEA